jgi:hypothetical protein
MYRVKLSRFTNIVFAFWGYCENKMAVRFRRMRNVTDDDDVVLGNEKSLILCPAYGMR